jgi:hypothetical protein
VQTDSFALTGDFVVRLSLRERVGVRDTSRMRSFRAARSDEE